ncbi:cupredoxin domain-containing protein [Candidatus Woesearchaeota archaeon]|nr:cupredoxin domain-containing protein [Candidatus Woesearchaeota archaeon]
MKPGPKQKNLFIVLVLLIMVIVSIFIFSAYKVSRSKKAQEEKYLVEEVIEQKDIIPEETETAPSVEESPEKAPEGIEEKETEAIGEVIIRIKNLKFDPKEVIISPGTTVVWINEDASPHKVVSYTRLFYGPRLSPGERYSFTFTQEGSHRYFDAVFPKIGKGTVIVKKEPLPITGNVVGVSLNKNKEDGIFALFILLFVIMILGLSHGIYTHYNSKR